MFQPLQAGTKRRLGESHCCKKPISELKTICFDEMKIPFVHEGRFLACRVLTEALFTVAITVVVEDIDEVVHTIFLYNFNTNLKASDCLKPGAIVLIKEPCTKFSNALSVMPIIRVDSPSDVIFVHETNLELLKFANARSWHKPEALSALELKKRGNAAFGNGKFDDALGLYERALAVIKDEDDEFAAIIHLNMAATLLELKRFSMAHEHAKTALDGGANKEKALYRLSNAAYGMRLWSEAIGHFVSVLILNPECNPAVEKLSKAKARLAESLTGNYNLRELFDADKRGEHLMDVADYIGPVKVVDIPGKGKCLLTTKDVPKGTLLLASKAYAIAFDPGDTFSSIGPVPFSPSYFAVTYETIQTLAREPQRAKELYGLYAGDKVQMKQDITDGAAEGVIDIERIGHICVFNAIIAKHDQWTLKEQEDDFVWRMGPHRNGLWIMPSYANHSCLSNTFPSFFGDLMMLRTICDLKKGEEVTINYCPYPLKPYEERKDFLAKKYGFQCQCRLCQLDRQEPTGMVEKRKELLAEFNEIRRKLLRGPHTMKTVRNALAQLAPLVDGIRKSYGQRTEMRIEMAAPLMEIAQYYRMFKQSEKGIEACNEVIDALGPLLKYTYIPDVYLRKAQIYSHGMDNHPMAKDSALKAYEFFQHKIGPMDKELFVQFYRFFWPFLFT